MTEANDRATAFYKLVLTDNEAAKALPPFEFDVSGVWQAWPLLAYTTLARPYQVQELLLRTTPMQAIVKHRYGPQVPVHFSISFSGSSELRVLSCRIM